jgi:hypothetical protein
MQDAGAKAGGMKISKGGKRRADSAMNRADGASKVVDLVDAG